MEELNNIPEEEKKPQEEKKMVKSKISTEKKSESEPKKEDGQDKTPKEESAIAGKDPWYQTNTFRYVIFGLAGLIVLLIIFQSGVYVGMNRAIYSYRWSQNYPNNFFPKPRTDLIKGMENRDMFNTHGAFGDIVKIDGQTVIVKGPQEAEKPVLINNQTPVSNGFDNVKPTDLKVGDHVLVIGSPNSFGQIDAKLVRLLPGGVMIQSFNQ